MNGFGELISVATDGIINEIGPQILDSISRDNIQDKVIQIINSGILDVDEIVQKFLDDNQDVYINVIF